MVYRRHGHPEVAFDHRSRAPAVHDRRGTTAARTPAISSEVALAPHNHAARPSTCGSTCGARSSCPRAATSSRLYALCHAGRETASRGWRIHGGPHGPSLPDNPGWQGHVRRPDVSGIRVADAIALTRVHPAAKASSQPSRFPAPRPDSTSGTGVRQVEQGSRFLRVSQRWPRASGVSRREADDNPHSFGPTPLAPTILETC
jgi:hypothetical protein